MSCTDLNNSRTYTINDLYKIIQIQQSTINELTQELTSKSQGIQRDVYEKALNDYENEKFQHAKTKLELIETRQTLDAKLAEIEYYKNELTKQRISYAQAIEVLSERAKSNNCHEVDLKTRIAETEILYQEALEDVNHKQKLHDDLCNKIKEMENSYQRKCEELLLKQEQDRYIDELLKQKSSNKK